MDNSEQQYNINDLAHFMKRSREDDNPYVFVTGAGCSVTAGIPLANQIVKELNEKFTVELKSLTDEDRKDYGKCMECIDISKRRNYLKNYIKSAKINWAHIALACLIESGYVRRVLTFNFDNLLARSCGLLGIFPATYDFTAANLNLHSLIDDPAIVHLHGQGHGFIQLNTQLETDKHATSLREFVRHTLNESPTLFIGYSGKNDAFLPQVETQFSGQHQLFWVDMSKQAPEHLEKDILKSNLANYISCNDGADIFLIQLAQNLNCFPPTIFPDPYQHLLNELNEVASYPLSSYPLHENETLNNNKDLLTDKVNYYTQDILIDNVNYYTQDILIDTNNRLKEAQQRDKDNEINILQEYMEGNYIKIIQVLETKSSLDNQQELWLARSYFGLALEKSSIQSQIDLYNIMIQKFSDNSELFIQDLVAKALFNKVIMLEKLGQLERLIEVCDDIVRRNDNRNELRLRRHVSKALFSKACVLGKLGRSEEAITVYNDIMKRFDSNDSLVSQVQAAETLFNITTELMKLGRTEDILNTYDELIEKFSDSSKLLVQVQVAKSLLNKAGILLLEFGKPEDAIVVYDKAIELFGNTNELILQETITNIMLVKAEVLRESGQIKEAIDIYDDFIERFDGSDEPFLKERVAIALDGRATLSIL